MKKQDLNVFNISFLDLMTGAFAAVIILFIVVPKLNVEDKQAIEKLKKLKVEMAEMDSLIANLKSTIPQKEYEALAGHSVKMQNTLGELEREIEKLRSDLAQEREEKEQLLERVAGLEIELEDSKRALENMTADYEALAAENNALRQRIQQLLNQMKKVELVPEKDTSKVVAYLPVTEDDTIVNIANIPQGSGDYFVGYNPPLAVVAAWEDSKTDVDLYLKQGSDLCYNYVRNRDQKWGKWIKAKQKGWFSEKNYEVIAQEKEIVPGEYQILLHQNSPKNGASQVRGFVIFSPPGKIARKIEFEAEVPYTKATPYRGGGGTLVGTLQVTEENISFSPMKQTTTVVQ